MYKILADTLVCTTFFDTIYEGKEQLTAKRKQPKREQPKREQPKLSRAPALRATAAKVAGSKVASPLGRTLAMAVIDNVGNRPEFRIRRAKGSLYVCRCRATF